jgi:hypothetical protein
MFQEDFGQVFDCTTSTINRLDDSVGPGGECISRRLLQDMRANA